MKRFVYSGPVRYCDIGIYEGKMRVEFTGKVYLDHDEYALYVNYGLTVDIADPGIQSDDQMDED